LHNGRNSRLTANALDRTALRARTHNGDKSSEVLVQLGRGRAFSAVPRGANHNVPEFVAS
jgi:hypothetical protein